MKKKIILLMCAVLMLSGCADKLPITYVTEITTVGFFHGVWHGIILPVSFIMSLFSDSAIYAVYNNGGWYDFGFMLGVVGHFGVKVSRK